MSSPSAEMVRRLVTAAPREVLSLLEEHPGLLNAQTDRQLSDLITLARRGGDAPKAARLEEARSRLRRYREFGARRAAVRETLDALRRDPASATVFSPAELQAELRVRIDDALDLGDMTSWRKWIEISIALEHATHAGSALDAAATARAAEYLDLPDFDAQYEFLTTQDLPGNFAATATALAARSLYQACWERDALEVRRLRQAYALLVVEPGSAYREMQRGGCPASAVGYVSERWAHIGGIVT